LAKLAAVAGTVAAAAPQVLPLLPAQYHPLAMALVGLLGVLGGGAMQSPLAPLAKKPLDANEPKR
jgi:hypothetical protein